MSYRTRDMLALDVSTAYGNTISVKAYIGMLSEDMLDVLTRQFLVRRMRGVAKWTGPDERIQQLLTGTVSSTKREF